MTLNYCTIITPEILFKHIELLQETPFFNVYRYTHTKGVIIRLPKGLEKDVACHVFFEHEINLTNTLKTKTLTFKVQLTFVPVSYGLFCGFERLEGENRWYEDEEYGHEYESFVPDYKSDKNVKRVAGLPPKVPLNMIEYLKEIIFQSITEAEMINKYAVSLGCQVKAMQDLMFIPVPTPKETDGLVSSKSARRNARTLELFNTISSEQMDLIPQKL